MRTRATPHNGCQIGRSRVPEERSKELVPDSSAGKCPPSPVVAPAVLAKSKICKIGSATELSTAAPTPAAPLSRGGRASSLVAALALLPPPPPPPLLEPRHSANKPRTASTSACRASAMCLSSRHFPALRPPSCQSHWTAACNNHDVRAPAAKVATRSVHNPNKRPSRLSPQCAA